MKSKILCFILCLAILCPAVVAQEKSERAVFDENEMQYAVDIMDELGILEKSEPNSNDIISRIDFAVYLARMLKVNEYEESEVTYFTDINSDHYALTCVNYLTNCGAFDGYGDSKFNPDAPIAPIEAAKAIFNCLGYRTYASLKGGYPNAYQEYARRTNLLDGFATNKDITRTEMAVLLLRAGLINELSAKNFSEDKIEFEVDKGSNIFSKYWDMYECEGVVEGCSNIVIRDTVEPSDGYLIINKEKYLLNGKRCEKFLGVYSRCLVREDKNGNSLIGIMQVTKKNTITEIKAKDIDGYANNVLSYYSDDKIKNIKISTEANIVYNGTIARYGMNALTQIDKGEIILIDSNNDNYAETVIIKSYRTYVVGYIDRAAEKIYQKSKSANLIADLKKYDYCGIYSSNGDAASVADISSDTVINVMESGNFIEIYVSNAVLEGKVTASYVNGDGESIIKVNEKEYLVDTECKKNADWFTNEVFRGAIGEKYKFLIDSFGEIAYVQGKGADELQAGYVIKASLDDIAETFTIKLFTSEGIIKRYETAKKVKIDGVNKKDAEEQMEAFKMGDQEVILFKVNDDDKITYIDTSYRNIGSEGKDTLYTSADAKEKRAWKVFNHSFGVDILFDKSTILFEVPNNKAGASDDEYAILSYTSYYDACQRYNRAYKFSPDNFADDVVVQYKVDNEDLSRSKLLIIDEVDETYVDDEVQYRIDGYTMGKSISYTVSTDCFPQNFKNSANTKKIEDISGIGTGDCIKYGVNFKGEISSMELMVDYSDGLNNAPLWAPSNKILGEGYVISRVFCNKKYKEGLDLTFTSGAAVNWRSNFNNGVAPITVYDSSLKKNRLRGGTVEDIESFELTGTTLPMFVYSYGYYLQDIIIYK